MTLFDWYVVGFIPVSIVLILIQFVMADWDIEKVFFEDKEK